MKKTVVKNIEIRYDENQDSRIDYIKQVINNNYNLFLKIAGKHQTISLVAIDDEQIVYLSDFDKTFYDSLDIIFNDKRVRDCLDNPEALSYLYVEHLVRKISCDKATFIQSNPDIDDDTVYSLIAYQYFKKNGTFNDFVNHLKTKEDMDKILKWIQTETRFQTYNTLLKTLTDFLEQNDFNFLENINDIVKIMVQPNTEIFHKQDQKEEQPPITLQELDNLFCEFLQSINAPTEWKQMYMDLKNSGRIAYEKQNRNIDNSKCYIDNNGVLRILVTLDGPFNCFYSLVHEFVHYISMQNSEIENSQLIQLPLSEFPSIFFEKLSAEFLKNKGYQDSIVDAVIKERNKNNLEIYLVLSSLFEDIINFIKNGPILRSDKIKRRENEIHDIQKVKETIAKIFEERGKNIADMNFLEQFKTDIENNVDKECDECIYKFIKDGMSIIRGYKYLLGTFLADELLKEYNNDATILTKMIQVSNNLGTTNLQNILIDLDIHSLFERLGNNKDIIKIKNNLK